MPMVLPSIFIPPSIAKTACCRWLRGWQSSNFSRSQGPSFKQLRCTPTHKKKAARAHHRSTTTYTSDHTKNIHEQRNAVEKIIWLLIKPAITNALEVIHVPPASALQSQNPASKTPPPKNPKNNLQSFPPEHP